jgi:RimJ/RimL family protein N-acetyltransferase
MAPPRVPLKTERLTLRDLTEADVPALVTALGDFTVSGWLTVVPHPYSEADARGFIAATAGNPGYDGWGIEDRRGALVGVIGIADSLGYWIARPFQGRGYATEAAEALVGHYFATTGADSLGSGHFEGNHPSFHVLEKLGFLRDGDARVWSRAQGMEMVLHKMRLSREDWVARHGD